MSERGAGSAAEAVKELTAQDAAFSAAASKWIGQLARTLKTCRLYDPRNPAVVRFRQELGASLAPLLQERGSLTLAFSATDVSWNGVPLYRARSREDNLAGPFFRDGIRTLTLASGIEPRECDALVDALLKVTDRAAGDADLVTMLWDADLPHVSVEHVSIEADPGDGAAESEGVSAGPSLMPWPQGSSAAASEAAPAPEGVETRSDDWATSDLAGAAETFLTDLEAMAPAEVARFRSEYEAESREDLLRSTLAFVGECGDSGATPADQEELSGLLLRLLQEAIAVGAWSEARQAAQLLRCRTIGESALTRLLEELRQPNSVVAASAVRELNHQGSQSLEEFPRLARELGPPATDWLMLMLAESRQQRACWVLTLALTELCIDSPERLAPWLGDERSPVVQSVVRVLGCIGGAEVLALLQTVTAHPDLRVRQEVAAALANTPPEGARRALLGLLAGADTSLFCAVLRQLASGRDPEVTRLLVGYLQAPGFFDRPLEERRAIYLCLAGAAQDEALPQLELELRRGHWFSGHQQEHRQAIARCIAHVGSPAAREILERGARGRSAEVRAACAAALEGMRPHG